MNEEQGLEQAQELFRETQEQVYSTGSFDAMADQIEDTGEFAPAISQLASTAIISVVKDAGVKDVGVLFALGIILIADLFDGLQKVGLEAGEEDFNESINLTIQLVMEAIPEFAVMFKEDPQAQEMMKDPQGTIDRLESGGELAQGVAEGAEQSRVLGSV